MSALLRRNRYRSYRSYIHANVGCSLGGMLARGLAVRRPDLVSGIVTVGSPMLAPAAHHALLSRSVDVLVRLSRAGVPGLIAEVLAALRRQAARQAGSLLEVDGGVGA